MRRKIRSTFLYNCLPVIASLLFTPAAHAGDEKSNDPHYTDAGFFDIHVCNWPDRQPFFMVLFSTFKPDAVESIVVSTPEGDRLAELDKSRYRILEQKGKPDKRVFINQIEIPPGSSDGWYSAQITLTDGTRISARDYVHLSRLPRADGLTPANESEVALPDTLRWNPVQGASYYQVFVRDLWNDGKLIYSSKLLERPELVLPKGLLEPGGYYSWLVHARDINEDVRLGDFNHGSLNKPSTFSVAP